MLGCWMLLPVSGISRLRILFGIVLIGFGLSSGSVSYGVEDVDEVSAFHISRSDPYPSRSNLLRFDKFA